MLKNLFGKKDNFYLQVDESEETAAPAAATPVEATTEATQTTAAPATPAPVAAPTAVNVPAADVPFWVTAMRSTEEILKTSKEPTSEMTFATDYLLSNGSTSRRRPGPSLNPFKEIAAQVKKPV